MDKKLKLLDVEIRTHVQHVALFVLLFYFCPFRELGHQN